MDEHVVAYMRARIEVLDGYLAKLPDQDNAIARRILEERQQKTALVETLDRNRP